MKILLRLLSAFFLAFGIYSLFVSCASIIKGNTQTVSINSNVRGATIEIDGRVMGKTPFVGRIPRVGELLVIKKEGYETKRFIFEKFIEPTFLLNIFVFPIIAHLIDISTGSMYRHASSNIHIHLEQSNQSNKKAPPDSSENPAVTNNKSKIQNKYNNFFLYVRFPNLGAYFGFRLPLREAESPFEVLALDFFSGLSLGVGKNITPNLQLSGGLLCNLSLIILYGGIIDFDIGLEVSIRFIGRSGFSSFITVQSGYDYIYSRYVDAHHGLRNAVFGGITLDFGDVWYSTDDVSFFVMWGVIGKVNLSGARPRLQNHIGLASYFGVQLHWDL